MRKIIAAILASIMVLCLSGCNMFTVDTEALITPPELTGDMYPISRALSKSIKGEYQLKYPSMGEWRSAIILEDIDGNGILEAFAFYSTSDDETTNMHINVICRSDGDYKSVADMSIVAGGVEQVGFCDFDGDGSKEIVVGWEVYGTSEKQLCVYSISHGELSLLLSEKYTGFLCCELAGDGKKQLLLQQLNTAQMINTATVYNLVGGKMKKIGSCVLDSVAKTVSSIVETKLANKKNAVYIEEVKGAGAVTEVLFFENGELKNPLLSTENTIENIRTLRAATIPSRDIDGDGLLEIPVATNLLNAANTEEQLYYTNWCTFDGENLTTKKITVVNIIDGYYLEIPEELAGRLAVLKDTENHRRVFYYYDAELDAVGDWLATVMVLSKKQWESDGFDRMNMFEITRSTDRIFAGAVNIAANQAISEERLKKMFKLG